jgi:carbon storage regulator CsrA
MLVLGRKVNQSIVIEPGGIRITITGAMQGGIVRLGIEAPPEFTVLREELVGKYGALQAQAEREERQRKEGST